MQQSSRREREDISRPAYPGMYGNGMPGTNIPGLSNTSGPRMSLNSNSPNWTLPLPTGQNPSFSFSYPNTPVPLHSGVGSTSMPYVAPPHLQPMSDVSNLHPDELSVNDLGFATLDDWFGKSAVEQETDASNTTFGGLDFQDFWMKVGPGEVSGHGRASLTFTGARRFPLPLRHAVQFFFDRSPNIRVPTRTLLLPSLTA
jgi:hypothetical protein